MDLGPPRRRRARPVADAPVRALLARERELAKGWLLALVEQAPLEEAGAILGGELAQAGPSLCAAMVRALRDDGELARLGPGGDLEPLAARVGEIGGEGDLQGTLRAVQTITEVVWSGIRQQLPAADPDLIGDLYARLTLIADTLRLAALRDRETVPSVEQARAPEAELEAKTEPPPSPLRAVASDPVRPVAPGAALWMEALEEEIARSSASGAPLSLLLVDLDDAERMRAAESPGEAGSSFARFLQAVRSIVRRQDILARETEERIWVIACDTARPGAQALGERALEAVREATRWRGAPLGASAGIAVMGEDAADGQGLVAACEEAAYAAAASGIGITPARVPDAPAPLA